MKQGPKGPRLFCKQCGRIVKQKSLPPPPDESTQVAVENDAGCRRLSSLSSEIAKAEFKWEPPQPGADSGEK